MAAPQIKINGGSAGVKASCSASSAVTATLDDITGIRSVTWSVASTDETSSTSDYTLVTSGSVGQNVSFTSGAAGTAGILKAVVNGGQDLQTELADSAGTTATCKFYVPLSNGLEVGAAGEKMESDPTFGSTAIINSGARAAASAASSTAHYWEDASTALNTNGVPTRAVPSTLNVVGASTIVPMTLGYQRAAGAFGTALKLRRVISSGTVDASTGADLEWTIPNTTPTEVTQIRLRPELTTVGVNLDTDLGLWLVSGGTITRRFLWHADGSQTWSGYGAGILRTDSSGNVTASATHEAPLTLEVDDATQNDTTTVLTLRHTYNAGFGANNLAAKLAFEVEDNAGNTEDAGFIVGRMTNVTNGAEVSQVELWTRTGGAAAVKNAYLTGTGFWTVVGGVRSPIVDAAAAGALTLGGTNATSIACSGLGLTGVASVANASGALALSSGSGDASLDADSSHVVNVATSTANGLTAGRSGKTTAINGGAITVTASGVLTLQNGSAVSPLYVYDAGGGGILAEAGGGNCTLRANSGSVVLNTGGATRCTVSNTSTVYTHRVDALRFIAAPSTPASSGSNVTFDLSASQNVKHSTTENTTVAFSNAVEGMAGYIEFFQGAVGYTITMPTNGTGVEYSNTIAALGTTAIVDTTAHVRTVLRYHVTGSPSTRVVIYFRDIGNIP